MASNDNIVIRMAADVKALREGVQTATARLGDIAKSAKEARKRQSIAERKAAADGGAE